MGTLKIWDRTGHTVRVWNPAVPETMEGIGTIVKEAVDNGQLIFETVEGEEPRRTEEFNPDAVTIHILAPIAGG